MKKSILKMIGIVFGTVFGFTGTVIGVMAAMGKFKTPVVYPTVLEFAVTEQIVIEGKTYDPELEWETQFEDENNRPKLESFVLSGTNPNFDHEVNKTKCYLWFQDSASSNLITLCDKDGHPLVPNKTNNRYLVDCNKPIYYMVNKVDENAQTDGKVVLMARSENETLKQPEKPMTIWIDRKVESVFVDYDQSVINERDLNQDIYLGIDMSFDFEYLVNTPLSLKPIAKDGVSKKDIELYYDVEDMDYGTDYVRVTQAEVDKPESPLHSILTYVEDGDNVTYTFKTSSTTPKTHTFYIAVFPTYADKERYQEYVKEHSISNYDKLRKTSEDDEIYMTFTTLDVTVEDIEISKAGLSGSKIILDLYSDNNYMYLDSESESNNLGLYMKKGENPNQVDDYTRFDEATLNGFTSDVWSDAEAKFSNEDINWDTDKTKTIVTTNLSIGENLKVIDYIYDADDESLIYYYCNNGVAVLDTKGTDDDPADDEIKLLKTGSYLNFYVYNSTTGQYTQATFEYDAEEIGTGRDKKWKIVAKTLQELNEGESLRVGILVVNNSGEFKFDRYFDDISVALDELPLSYDYAGFSGENVSFNETTKQANIDITFDYDEFEGDIINYPILNYNSIITNLNGTYRKFVYVVEESDKNIVDTISNVKYVVGTEPDTKTYVLVGYQDELSGKFVNAVRVNSNVSNKNQTCPIYMLQLKHGFEQGVNDIINETVLAEGKTFEETEVIKLEEQPITINAKYILNTSLMSYDNGTDGEENIKVYENTSGKVITVHSTNSEMLSRVYEFYDNLAYVGVTEQYASRIEIAPVLLIDGSFEIPYSAKEALDKPHELEIELWFELGGAQFGLGKVIILNGSPESIVLRYGELNEEIELDTSYDDAIANQENYITAILGYEEGFTYSFKVNDTVVDSSELFNKTILFGGKGFQDGSEVNQEQTFNVVYDATDNSIFDSKKISFSEEGALILDSGLILKTGETVLKVAIDSTVGYIKIKTDTTQFNLSPKNESQTSYTHDSQTATLDEFVNFKYDGTDLPLSVESMVYIKNLECVEYGDGKLQLFEDKASNLLELKKNRDAEPVLTIQDDGTGWSLNKSNYYIGLKISFDVETVNNKLTISVEFSSSVNIGISDGWKQDRTIYAGTKVSLSGNENSLFKVEKAVGITIDVGFKVKNPETVLTDTFTLNDDYIGEISIVPVIGGTEVEEEFIFEVKPNVIATLKTTELITETTLNLSDVYELKAFNTSVVFGSGSVLYTKTVYYLDDSYAVKAEDGDVTEYSKIEFNEDYISPLTDTTNLQFKTDSQTKPTLTGGSTLQISAMEDLGVEKLREISLVYYGFEIRKDGFKITNKHDVEVVDTDNVNEEILTFNALKEYENFVKVDGFELTQITAEGVDFVISGDSFTINTVINQKYENVEVGLTFKKLGDEQLLTYTYEINLLPYQPETKPVLDKAYSGSNYDLLAGIYDVNELVADAQIQKLYVTGVKYSPSVTAENKASSLIANWVDGGSGYTVGVAAPACAITFNEISGDNLQVYVEFSITYVNEKTYVYYVPLTISNRQMLTLKYPENDMKLTNGYFKFLSGYEKDALYISGLENNTVDNLYNLTELPYEAVLLYTDATNTLNFNYDEIKKINRVVATNVETLTNVNQLNIELIAYQNNGGMADYVDKINNTSHTGNKITLPSAQQGMFGVLIFKISTESGNFVYYNVYVYCKDKKVAVNVNTEHNLDLFVYNDDYTTIETALTKKVVENNTTYGDLVSAIGGESLYYSTFKTDYNNNTTKIYLYDVEVTGGIFDNSNRYSDVSDVAIKLDGYYNTITLGLVIDKGVEEYCYGTITIYVQPKNDVLISGLDYETPNGYFTADVEASTTEIASPFGEDWNATIVSIDGVEYDLDIHSKYVADGSIISLEERVSKDTEILVKYADIVENTIVYVTYSYKATSIPNQTNNTVVIGRFENETTGFNTVIDIKSTVDTQGEETNKEYFFGTYDNDYDWEIVSEMVEGNVELDKATNTIRFTQIHEEQIIKIKITYLNFDSEDKSRIFTFKVLAGVHFVTESSNDSGLSSTDRVNTIKKGSGVYSGVTGSTLSFEKEEINSSLYKYVVAGLTIYTNSTSKLILTFDKANYVLNDDEDDVLKVDDNSIVEEGEYVGINTDGEKVNFVHTATNQTATMTISIQNEAGQQFAQRNLYLNIIQTYKTLRPVYLTDGAQHENVTSGYLQTDIHSALLGSRNRIVLVDENGNDVTTNFDLLEMGFSFDGNPNKIEFTISANASLKINTRNTKLKDIQFNSVSTNTLCKVYLNNVAGIETNSVVYTYQIMAGDKVDGLDYSSTSGFNGTEETNPYLSFVLEDTDDSKAYSNKFVLGTMKDLKNENVFLVEDYVQKQTSIVGGYESAVQYMLSEADDMYLIYLTLDLTTKQVELYVTRAQGNQKATSNISVTLRLGGVNGAGTIAENLKVVLSNHIIEEKYNPELDTSIYAGYKINLFEATGADGKYDDGKFVENNGNSPVLTYSLGDSEYTIAGQKYYIEAGQINNDLFIYDQTARTIQTNAVASDVNAVIRFLVKDGNYVIKTVTYNLNIYLNFKFVVNGDETSALETDFVLTNKATTTATYGNKFPIEKNFIDGSEIETEDFKRTTKTTYYKVLSYDLYRIKSQTNEYVVSKDNTVKVTLNSNISGDILKVSNTGIVFYQDYSGEIELKLSIETKNGIYSQYWTIYVTPILDIDLAKTETSILQTNASAAFNSGDSVDLISNVNNRTNEGVGVVVNSDTNFYDYITYKYGNGARQDSVTITYSYKIYKFNASSGISGLTSNQLFNLSANETLYNQYSEYFVASGENSGTLDGHRFPITLPNVPSTMDVQSYLVVYEIYGEYLDLTRVENEAEVFYVTYNVINKQKVEQYSYQTNPGSEDWYSSADVNVDTRVYQASGKYYLDLLYYEEKIEDKDYRLYHSANNIKLSDGSQTYAVTSNNDVELIFNSGEFKYNIASRELSKRNAADTSKYDVLGIMEQTTNYSRTYYSVFESNFTNIVEYKNFLNLYLGDKVLEEDKLIKGVSIGNNYFSLVEINDGRYGINLNENGGTLFNNELNEELSLVVDGVKAVTIEEFRLSVTNSIKPKGEVYSISEMGLINYFTAGTSWDSNLKVIGVGSPATTWVTGASTLRTDTTTNYGTVSIPNGNGNTTYQLHKVTYSGSGGNALYTISQSYYYFAETSLVVPSYTGVESYLYSVSYNPNESGNVVLNLANAVKVWVTNSGKLVNNSSSVNYSNFDVLTPTSGITEPVVDYTNKTLTLSANELSEYKVNNPKSKSYPIITAKINANGTTLQFVIEYALPETAQFFVRANATNNINIQLPDVVDSVKNSEDYIVSYSGKRLTLNGIRINEYFTANPLKTQQVLPFVATLTDGATVNFEVVVIK